MKIILNPCLLYALIWSFLLLLYSQMLSELLLPLSIEAFIYFATTIIVFIFGFLTFSLITNKIIISPNVDINIYKNWILSRNTSKTISILSKILLLGLSVELLYFQNLPLFSILGFGKTILYTEFGFQGIHGLLNSILLVIITLRFARQIIQPDVRNLFIIIILLLWPVLLVTRQLFITIALQFILIFILIRGANYKIFMRIVILIFLLIYIFGYLGDLRSGREGIIALARPTIEYPSYLPSGFLWVYIYMVSPLNNVVNNISIAPYYAPVNIVSNLIPSFARDSFQELFTVNTPIWELVNPILNVSSIHQKYITDFGLYGSNIIYFIMSFYFCYLLKRAKNDPRYGFALIVILHGIIVSFFVDFLLHLVFIAQLIFYITLFKKPYLDA
jgi:oligosaccharide repeat unit polymerase